MIRVLIADGSERIRANLQRRLSAEEDITVCGMAADGEHALQEALHLVPDIAVLDAGLTGLDGVQTTEMLAEYAPQAGVILMSMESGSELFRRAMLAGAREVLQKPFTGRRPCRGDPPRPGLPGPQAGRAVGPPARQRWRARRPEGVRRRDGRMITIVSGKGRVGKSIIATNLALILNRPTPGSVVLVDLSLQFGDIAALLAMTPEGTIAEFAASDASIADRHVIQQALSLGPQGLTVVAAPPSPELADYVTTAHLRSLVAELRSSYEMVVADTTVPALARSRSRRSRTRTTSCWSPTSA